LVEREQRVEARELEQGPQVLVEIREPEGTVGLANLFRQRHECAEAGAVDIARISEVYNEGAGTAIEL